MKTASSDIRLVVIRAHRAGLPRKLICELVGYHVNTVNRWIRDYENDSRISPKNKGHRRAVFSNDELDRLRVLIEDRPDITLNEIREVFGKTCSLSSVYNHVRRLGFGLRKKAASVKKGKGYTCSLGGRKLSVAQQ